MGVSVTTGAGIIFAIVVGGLLLLPWVVVAVNVVGALWKQRKDRQHAWRYRGAKEAAGEAVAYTHLMLECRILSESSWRGRGFHVVRLWSGRSRADRIGARFLQVNH